MTLSAADSQEILQLVARADAMATDRDAAGYVALFTADADQPEIVGVARVRQTVVRTDTGWRIRERAIAV